MINIETKLIPIGTKRRSGQKIQNVGFIVLHDTGNDGSTAIGNVNYFIRSADDISASAHLFVDDKQAIMCIPCFENSEKAWHVLYGVNYDNIVFGYDANDIAIGVECCYFSDDIERTRKAYDNYLDVIVKLLIYHNLELEDIAPHFKIDPTRKVDPNNMLRVIGKTYTDLENDIIERYGETVKKTWIELINENTSNPQDWIKGINAIKEIASLQNNVGDIEIFKYIDILLEKIGNN